MFLLNIWSKSETKFRVKVLFGSFSFKKRNKPYTYSPSQTIRWYFSGSVSPSVENISTLEL